MSEKEYPSYQQLGEEDEPQNEEEDRRKRRNMFTLILTSSIAMLGFGIYGTAYSQWIYVRFEMDVLGDRLSQMDKSPAKDPCFRGNQSDSPFKSLLDEAQAKSARFGVWTTLCSLIPSVFVNLLLGAYADQMGRRIIFIVPLAGTLIGSVIVCAVAQWNLHVNFVLVSSLVSGLTGDFPAYIMAIYVYTADNTTSGKNRSFLMIVTSAMSFMFATVSHFATGYFIEAVGYVWPLLTGVAAQLVAFVLVVMFLRETLDTTRVKRVTLLQGIKGIFSFYFDKPVNPLYKRKDFIMLGLVFFTYTCSMSSRFGTIFLMNEPFCWGSRQLGIVNSVYGLVHSVVSTLLMRLLQMFLSDEVLVVLSLLSSITNRFVMAFAGYSWQVYIASAVGALEISVLAVIRAILSRMVPKEKRGSLFASLAVMETATFAASGAGLNELYSNTVKYWRGLTYFVIGCIVVLSAALMITYKIIIDNRQPASNPDEVELETKKTKSSEKHFDIATVSNGVDNGN